MLEGKEFLLRAGGEWVSFCSIRCFVFVAVRTVGGVVDVVIVAVIAFSLTVSGRWCLLRTRWSELDALDETMAILAASRLELSSRRTDHWPDRHSCRAFRHAPSGRAVGATTITTTA